MRATGIIRRIDDLGRVVIPREVRQTLRIREGDPLEIYTGNDGEVIFKKYHPLGELQPLAVEYAASLNEATGIAVLICDRDKVIAVSGAPKRELLDKRRISDKMANIMDGKRFFSDKKGSPRIFVVDNNPFYVQCAMPIIADGEVMGCVIAGVTDSDDSAKVSAEAVEILIKTSAKLLGNQTTRIW